jgi:ketosteroid isomerase-like protein
VEETNKMSEQKTDNRQLIESFYQSFQQKDWRGMQSCYHPEVQFSDPVFPNLTGSDAMAMWHMLVLAGKDLTIEFSNVKASETEGSCDWDARYSFSKTGRRVHNIIHANFAFKDGKIYKHTDSFDLWRWTRMAIGPVGTLLGWSPMVQNKIRVTAADNLRKFIRGNP